MREWPYLQGLKLADPEFCPPSPWHRCLRRHNRFGHQAGRNSRADSPVDVVRVDRVRSDERGVIPYVVAPASVYGERSIGDHGATVLGTRGN